MQFLPGHTYHVYNQGNNKKDIFYYRKDYLLFLREMRKALLSHCSILAWCLMPNHFHWLIHINEDYRVKYEANDQTKKLNTLNRNIGSMLSSYTQQINKKSGRSGSLFRKRTKSKSLSEYETHHSNYGVNCFIYIHQNPLRAGLVDKMEDWEFSSFRDYAGLRDGTVCNKDLALGLFDFPKNPKEFYKVSQQTIPDSVLQKIF